MTKAAWAIILLCAWLPACKKKAVPPKPSEQTAAAVEKPNTAPRLTEAKTSFPEGFEKLAPEAKDVWLKAEVKPKIPQNLDTHPAAKQAHWLEMLVALEKRNRLMAPDDALAKIQSVKVRRDYVRPAPRGFKPEDAKRKIKVILVSGRAMMRIGERFSYRLEIQNVGREPIQFYEPHSDFLVGHHQFGKYKFIAILPNGTKKLLPMATGHDLGDSEVHFPGEERMTTAEKDAAARQMELEGRHDWELDIILQPGEALVSKARGGAFGAFNELPTSFKFKIPGTYRIKAAYDDPPPEPPAEEKIQRLIKKDVSRENQMRFYRERVDRSFGRVESETVSIEVIP